MGSQLAPFWPRTGPFPSLYDAAIVDSARATTAVRRLVRRTLLRATGPLRFTLGEATTRHLAQEPGSLPRRPLRRRLRAHFVAWWPIWIAFVVTRTAVLVVGMLNYYAANNRGIEHLVPLPRAGSFIRLASIVANGYQPENATEYPLLPGLMSTLELIGMPLPVAALLISNVAFLIGLLGFAMLGERYVGREAAIRAATYLTIFPSAYFFSIGSSESVMLATLMVAALLGLRGTWGSWLGAGVAAALCALSRPPGALVGVILLAIAIGQLSRHRLERPAVAAAMAAVAAVPAAVFGFFFYLGRTTCDFFAAVHAQEQFGRESVSLAGPARAVGGAISSVRAGSVGEGFELAAALAIAAAAVVFAARAVGDRWEVRGWVAFAWASLLIPLATGLVWQMPRFALLIPPLFWMLGVIGRRQWLHLGLLLLLPMGLAFSVMFEVVPHPPRPAGLLGAERDLEGGDATVPEGVVGAIGEVDQADGGVVAGAGPAEEGEEGSPSAAVAPPALNDPSAEKALPFPEC